MARPYLSPSVAFGRKSDALQITSVHHLVGEMTQTFWGSRDSRCFIYFTKIRGNNVEKYTAFWSRSHKIENVICVDVSKL